MRNLLPLIAIVTMSGCSDAGIAAIGAGAAGPVERLLWTDSPRYAAGATVTLQLLNRTNRPLGYNLCRARLERRNDEGDWRPALHSLGEVCTAELRTLRAGQTASFGFTVEPRLRGGEYRISAVLEDLHARSSFEAVSNTFTIERSSSD